MTKNEYIQDLAAKIALKLFDHNICPYEGIPANAVETAKEIAELLEWEDARPSQSPEEKRIIEETRDLKLSSLGLTTRVLNCCKGEDITTLEQLLRCSGSYVLTFQNLGRHSFDEIVRCLNRKNLHLGMLPAMWVCFGHTAYKTDGAEQRDFKDWKDAEEFVKNENKKLL